MNSSEQATLPFAEQENTGSVNGPPSRESDATDGKRDGLVAIIGRMAGMLALAAEGKGALGTAELAALRTLDVDKPHPRHWSALVRLMLAAELEPASMSPDQLRAWARVVQGMAMVRHHGGARLGRQLAEAKVAESRLTRLLSTRGDAFVQYLPRIVRLVGARGESLNWIEMARLTFGSVDHAATSADVLRLRIASDYYAALPRDAQ